MKSLITDKKLLKNGGRKAVPFSESELTRKIMEKAEAINDEVEDLRDAVETLIYNDSKISKDLAKIDFDYENLDVGDECYLSNTGFNQLHNGFTYLLCAAGGDWEQPVGFIIYWDGKALRGYIPTLGNTFNLKHKCAFGSEPNVDDEPEADNYDIHEVYLIKLLAENGISADDYDGEYDLDFELFEEDIEHRIEIPGAISQARPAQTCGNTVVKNTPVKNTPSVNQNITKQLMSDFFDVENCTPLDLVLIPQIVARYDLTPEEKIEFIKSDAYKKLKKTFEEKVDEFEKRVFDEVFGEHENDIFATVDDIADMLKEKHKNGTSIESDNTEDTESSADGDSNGKKQYYWQFNGDTDDYDGDDECKLHVLVAEKSYYDQFGVLDDRGVNVPELEALGFLEGSESCYETDYTFKGTPTKASIRKLINTLDNFTEHKMF